MVIQEKRPLACVTCAKAKSRCIPGPADSDKCERCHRLSKSCISRDPAPPRAKKRAKRSRVAELEKRLSELSSRVANGQHFNLQNGDGRQSSHGEEGEEEGDDAAGSEDLSDPSETVGPEDATGLGDIAGPGSEGQRSQQHEQRNGEGRVEEGQREGSKTAQAAQGDGGMADGLFFGHLFPPEKHPQTLSWPSRETLRAVAAAARRPMPPDPPWPAAEEAEEFLDTYRTKLEGLFPFVPIPPAATAAELRQKRPFLWKGLVTACCILDGARQKWLGDELAAEIGRVAVMEGGGGLDMLQGLQIFLSWLHHDLSGPRLTNFLFLARSMCLNLGLGGNSSLPSDVMPSDLDPQRAYAGTYYLNTLVLTTNKRTEVLMNTSYLETCCRLLETAKQQPSDEYLVKLVRIQQLSQAITITVALDPSQRAPQLPLPMVVQSFQEQIRFFAASIPLELSNNAMLNGHIAIAEILLSEIALSELHCGPPHMRPADRLELLWSCVRSLRSYFSGREMHEESLVFPRFLCLHSSDLAYTLLIAVKLVTLRLPGWDLERVDRELDFCRIMDDLVFHLGSVVSMRETGWLTAQVKHKYHDPFRRLQGLVKGLQAHVKEGMQRARADNARSPGASSVVAAALQMTEEMNGGDFWPDFMNDSMWMSLNGAEFSTMDLL